MATVQQFKSFLWENVGDKVENISKFYNIPDDLISKSILEFCNKNQNLWISDEEIDFEQLHQQDCFVEFGQDCKINLHDLFFYLSRENQIYFWKFICSMIGRDPEQLRQERLKNLKNAAFDFSSDLKNININMTPEEIVDFVKNNKTEANLRSIALLKPKLNIEKTEQQHFWNHFDNVYKYVFPYETSTVSPLPFQECIESISNSNIQDCSSPQEMITKLLNPEMMTMVMEMMNNPQALGGIFKSMMPLLNNIK